MIIYVGEGDEISAQSNEAVQVDQESRESSEDIKTLGHYYTFRNSITGGFTNLK